MANLFQPSLSRVTDTNGNPISAAKMFFYLEGTTTQAAWFTDQAGTVEGTNPLTADSSGQFATPAYLDPDVTYRIRLTEADGATLIWPDVDTVRGYDSGMVQTAADAIAASATGAATSATAASTSATSASTAQTGAETARTGAETAETNAEAVVTSVSAALATGTVSDLVATRIYTTRALLEADLVPADGLYALVMGDATAANNDLYKKVGATTTGSWTGPLGFFAAASAEATAQAAIATTKAGEASVSAAGAAAGILNTNKAGVPDAPVTGTVSTDQTFVEENPQTVTRVYGSVRLFAANAGTIYVQAWDRSSTVFKLLREVAVVVPSTGDQTITLPTPLLIAAGEHFGQYSPSPAVVVRTAPATAGRTYRGVGGRVTTTFTSSVSLDSSFQIGVIEQTDKFVTVGGDADAIIIPDWVEDPTRIEVDFTAAQYWNPETSKVGPISDVIRLFSDAGRSIDSKGRIHSFAANAPRLTDQGLRIEGYAITNLAAAPSAPATQTITLVAGTYTVSCWGAGSIAVSGASLSLTVAQGLRQSFTLAVGADITFTVSGELTWMQVETGTRTSMPVSGTRAADLIVPMGILATALSGAAWTAVIETDAVRADVQPILGGAADKVPYFRHTSATVAATFPAGGTITANTNGKGAFGEILRSVIAGDAATLGISAAGEAATASATAIVPVRYIGQRTTPTAVRPADSFLLRKLLVSPTRKANAALPALSAVPNWNKVETFYIPSSIDPTLAPANRVRVGYDSRRRDAPVIVLMHGWDQSVDDFGLDPFNRLVQRGFFVVAPDMRGRPDTGTRDGSGREIYDIIDAVRAVRERYRDHAHPREAHMLGYSGGGGNALACAMKCPDLFASITSSFGMSDYGYNATYGWYYTNTSFQAGITTSIGNPATTADRHRSRYAIEGVPANLQGGQLFLFHDAADASVSVEHSRQMVAAMTAAGNTRYTYRESASTNSARWLHNLPTPNQDIVNIERILLPKFLSGQHPAWSYPLSGSARVHGYLVTEHFEIFLDDGKSSVATVAFNVATRSYTITPVTAGSIVVVIRQGELTTTQTISSATVMTVA